MRDHGFTLIELMIVVAIVGLLAAIAIPTYQNYVIRAKITEALNAASYTKTYVSIYHAESGGNLPQNSADVGLSATDELINLQYVSKIEVQADGRIVVTVRGSALNQAADATFVMVPSKSGGGLSWSCKPPGTIEYKYLPSNCRPDV